MFTRGVLVVLTNYRRPGNMERVINAWKGQSVAPREVVVVDNSPEGANPLITKVERGPLQEGYPRLPELAHADDVWRMRKNHGCTVRFTAALAYAGHQYTLFADDDLVPGPYALEYALRAATQLEGQFATLGTIGRNFLLKDLPPPSQLHQVCQSWRGVVGTGKLPNLYSGKSCPTRPPDVVAPCNMTCQVHLVRADVLHHVLAFRTLLLSHCESIDEVEHVAHLCRVHDDFLLSCGVQWATCCPSYLVPPEPADNYKLVKDRLPEGDVAIWRRPGHFAERTEMVARCLIAGWRPVPHPNPTPGEGGVG